MSEAKFSKFQIPQKVFDDLYEFSGDKDKFKGFIIAICDEKGDPLVCTSADSQLTENGLLKCLEDYIDTLRNSEHENIPE